MRLDLPQEGEVSRPCRGDGGLDTHSRALLKDQTTCYKGRREEDEGLSRKIKDCSVCSLLVFGEQEKSIY